ncbi:MAG: 30S ribosomal protein S20 [Candidatus Omnitrophota bacterium]
MPQRKCAAKRLRADKKRKLHKLSLKSDLKKELKGLRALLVEEKIAEAKEKIKNVFRKLDRAASKGLLHKNTAARQKSSLAIKLNKKA